MSIKLSDQAFKLSGPLLNAMGNAIKKAFRDGRLQIEIVDVSNHRVTVQLLVVGAHGKALGGWGEIRVGEGEIINLVGIGLESCVPTFRNEGRSHSFEVP